MVKYDFKKTAKKVGIVLAEVIVAGAIVYLTDNNLYMALVPALEGLRNYIKHGR